MLNYALGRFFPFKVLVLIPKKHLGHSPKWSHHNTDYCWQNSSYQVGVAGQFLPSFISLLTQFGETDATSSAQESKF